MIMNNIDLDKIRATPIEEVAEYLGIGTVHHMALCPFHNDKKPSLHFNVMKNRYKCYACGAAGNVIDLVMSYNNVGFKEAVKVIKEERGERSEERGERSEEREYRTAQSGDSNPGSNISHSSLLTSHSSLPTSHSSLLTSHSSLLTSHSSLYIDTEYLSTIISHPVINEVAGRFLFDERRIDRRVVEWCGLTSISSDMPCWRWGKAFFDAPSLLIPYRDVDGKLLTVQGRYLGKEKKPRFKFPIGSQAGMYNKPMIATLKKGDELWITEGPSDCWAMMSAGRKAVAIPSATSLTTGDLRLLGDGLQKGVSLHMAPDNDRPGMELFKTLKRHFPDLQGHVLPDGVKDFGEMWKLNSFENESRAKLALRYEE